MARNVHHGSSRRHTPTVAAALAKIGEVFLVPFVLIAGLTACSPAGADARCTSAFRSIDPRALPADGVSPLDDAVRACGSIAEWRAAWNAVPGAHEGSTDAMGELARRCAVPSLSRTAICLEVSALGSTG
ncbi:MAG: hypothetical protein ABI620_06850 [Chloroflexota bacterium]